MLQLSKDRTWLNDIVWLTLGISGLFFLFLGTRPLFTPDEGRYAEIAREMIVRHDYLTPYLNGIKYFEKPVLFYWLEAAAIHIAGLNLWSLRAINAVLGIGICISNYVVGRYFYERVVGIAAALILATSFLFFVMSHMIGLDLPVTFFLTITLYSYLFCIKSTASHRQRQLIYVSACAAAAGVLTKGLIGVVFPAAIIAIYLTLTRSWQQLKNIPLARASILFLILALPWHFLVNAKNPEFFYFYIIEQHFLRYTNPNIGHYQSNWFFLPYLILGFFPWILCLPAAIVKVFKTPQLKKYYAQNLFLLIWIGFVFLFFSFSKSKLIPYILPIFPPLALLIAFYLAPILKKSARARYLFALTLGLLSVLLLAFIIALPRFDHRSIRPLVSALPRLTTNDRVITYNQYYQDLPFYLERRVMVLNWQNELSFGMAHQPNHDWMINTATFWQLWRSPNRVYVFINREEFTAFKQQYPTAHPVEIAGTSENILMTNRLLSTN